MSDRQTSPRCSHFTDVQFLITDFNIIYYLVYMQKLSQKSKALFKHVLVTILLMQYASKCWLGLWWLWRNLWLQVLLMLFVHLDWFVVHYKVLEKSTAQLSVLSPNKMEIGTSWVPKNIWKNATAALSHFRSHELVGVSAGTYST